MSQKHMTRIEQVAHWAMLDRLQTSRGDSLVARLSDEQAESLGLRNLCARVSAPLVDEVSRVAASLDISRRQFIEDALIDACDRVRGISDEYREMLSESAGGNAEDNGTE